MSGVGEIEVPVPGAREPVITTATTNLLARTDEVSEAPMCANEDIPALALTNLVTPAPAPASESVFQSGMRSVKRLLFGPGDVSQART
jgi:hypothetical protein